MGLRRFGAAAVVAAVLGLVGTACQPQTEQMHLDAWEEPLAKYEVLTKVLTLNFTIACTRPTGVWLKVWLPKDPGEYIQYIQDVELKPLSNGGYIWCTGPDRQTYSTKWSWPKEFAPASSLLLYPEASTFDPADPTKTPAIDRSGAGWWQVFTVTKQLCWPLPTTCASV